MSFGTNNETKTAQNNLAGIGSTATNQLFPQVTAAGGNALTSGADMTRTGANTTQPAINFLNTLLSGNQANTTAALQPSIDQIRANQSGVFNGINTLMPRGGGRGAALFGQSFAPQSQIQNLFNTGRTSAASTLPGIGLQQQSLGLGQQGVGANLFGIGNSALGTAAGTNTSLGNMGLQAQQMKNNLFAGLGSGLFSLATTPFGGGSATNGLLGLI
jgi:hypothetical protein